MNDSHRDLLVLSKSEALSAEQKQREIEKLRSLLYSTETFDSFCVANEILDLNRHKRIHKKFIIQKILREYPIKPFVFIVNKN